VAFPWNSDPHIYQDQVKKGSLNLEELSLEGCKLVTDEGLRHLIKCTKLNVLNISHCLNVTTHGIESLLRGGLHSSSLASNADGAP